MIPVRFSQLELNRERELNTAMASRVKSTGGIRIRDRKFQEFGVERSNNYSIETRHLKRWYATCE